MTFRYYRPWAVIRIKSGWAKKSKTELPPMGGISESPDMMNHSRIYSFLSLYDEFYLSVLNQQS